MPLGSPVKRKDRREKNTEEERYQVVWLNLKYLPDLYFLSSGMKVSVEVNEGEQNRTVKMLPDTLAQ